MRNRAYPILILIFSTLFTNCEQHKKTEGIPVKVTKSRYQCPMRCTDEVFEHSKNCPVCGAKLKKMVEG